MRLLLVGVIGLTYVGLASSLAVAEPAGDLLAQCEVYERYQDNPGGATDSDMLDIAFCIGYVRGAVEQMMTQHEVQPGSCPPVPLSVSGKQAVLIVLKWLREHPEHHHWEARGEVFSAMATAFPCK